MAKDLLLQEVEELTALLRHDKRWGDLRAAVAGQALDPGSTWLAGFHEDEDGREYGVLVAGDGVVFRFTRSSRRGSRGFLEWADAGDGAALRDEFPALGVALRLARRGGAPPRA
jgi:hypothetical protein